MSLEARRSHLERLAFLSVAVLGAGMLWCQFSGFLDWSSRGGVGLFFGSIGAIWVGVRGTIFPIGNKPILIIDETGIFDRRVMKRPILWQEVISLTDTDRGRAVEINVSVPEALAKSVFARIFDWDRAGNAKIILKGLDRSPAEIRATLAPRMADAPGPVSAPSP
nr:hypothetical protein [uncultured Dongia sp.]